jgi:hypothetical protein
VLYAGHLVGSLRTSSGIGRVNTFRTYWINKNLHRAIKTRYVTFLWTMNVIRVCDRMNWYGKDYENSNYLICESRCESERHWRI